MRDWRPARASNSNHFVGHVFCFWRASHARFLPLPVACVLSSHSMSGRQNGACRPPAEKEKGLVSIDYLVEADT